MHIELLGGEGVKITSRDKIIILSPAPEGGKDRPSRGKADVVVLRKPGDKIALTPAGEKLFIIDSAGEYESAGVFFYCLPNRDGNELRSILTCLEAEEMSVACLSGLRRELNDAELELFENTDILLIPFGEFGLDAKTASQLAADIEPRVVIPVGGEPEKFIKEMGVKAEAADKLKINKKDLPQEGMRIFNLQT